MGDTPRKPVLPNVALACALVLMLAVAYVLSYAPVVQSTGRTDQIAYRPCAWLHSVPFAREPLIRWASRWGVYATVLIELEAAQYSD